MPPTITDQELGARLTVPVDMVEALRAGLYRARRRG
jgi:hypothetical protein